MNTEVIGFDRGMAYLDLEICGAGSYNRDFLRGRCVVEGFCAWTCEGDAADQDVMNDGSREEKSIPALFPSVISNAVLVLTGTRIDREKGMRKIADLKVK